MLGGVAPSQLDIVLVTIDTLRADRLSSYGADEVATPHLDRLAREGVRFANNATTIPFTLPAHTSLMTGTYPPHHGVRENVGYVVDERDATLAELLSATGRETAGFVSAFVLDRRWGIARGFDHYLDDFELAGSGGNLGSVQRPGDETITAAFDWLDARAEPERPFFLWLHLFEPHDPYTPPEPFRSQYPDRPYDGEVAYADSLVGRFRQGLEERGLLDRSLLVLTGDHGEGLGDHGEGFHGYFVYDSTVHVPLILRFPGGAAASRVVTEATSHVDLMPTLLELVGAEPLAQAQGRSLLPLLLGQPEAAERVVYTESYYPLLHYGWAPLRALRTRSHKFIDAPQAELYELAADPGEARNVLQEQRPVSRALAADLSALVAALATDRDETAPADLDEETLAQLRSLGYVAGRGRQREHDGAEPRADPKDRIRVHRLVMLAQSDLSQQEEERAEARLREALAIDDAIIDAHQMLGSLELQRGSHDAAIAHFRRALELDPEHRASLFGLASAYRASDRLDEAVIGFERLLALAGRDSTASLTLAEIHVERGELERARAVLEEATAGAGAPARLFNQLGELQALQDEPESAMRSFEEALRRNDALVEPRFNLAVLDEERAPDRAVELYEEVIRRAPRHFQAQFNLGRLYGALGRLDRQQELFEAAIDSNPDFVRGYYFLGKLLMDRGDDLGRAEELTRAGLERAERRNGEAEDPLGYFVLADILNRQGRRREAMAALGRGREIESRARGR